MISRAIPLRGFLMQGKGNVLRKSCFVTVQFLGILIIMMCQYIHKVKELQYLNFDYILVNAE